MSICSIFLWGEGSGAKVVRGSVGVEWSTHGVSLCFLLRVCVCVCVSGSMVTLFGQRARVSCFLNTLGSVLGFRQGR
jgi:hypothetical protein